MIEDMTVRNFVAKTRNDHIRHVRTFTAFLGRSPDTAVAEDLRRFQLHQTQTGVRAPSINGSVAALRFFFTVTPDHPEMARHLTFVREPRKIPTVLSPEEVARLLEAARAARGGPATASTAPRWHTQQLTDSERPRAPACCRASSDARARSIEASVRAASPSPAAAPMGGFFGVERMSKGRDDVDCAANPAVVNKVRFGMSHSCRVQPPTPPTPHVSY
jgi:hypothetical protein